MASCHCTRKQPSRYKLAIRQSQARCGPVRPQVECDAPGDIIVRVRAFTVGPTGVAFQIAFLQVTLPRPCECAARPRKGGLTALLLPTHPYGAISLQVRVTICGFTEGDERTAPIQAPSRDRRWLPSKCGG